MSGHLLNVPLVLPLAYAGIGKAITAAGESVLYITSCKRWATMGIMMYVHEDEQREVPGDSASCDALLDAHRVCLCGRRLT